MYQTAFGLDPIPPFRLDLTAWALRRRPANIVDRWDGSAYSRALWLGGRAVEMRITQPDRAGSLSVLMRGPSPITAGESREAALIARRMLGLEVDLTPFYGMSRGITRLAPLVDRFRGVKPPRFPTVFEALVNAVACQQLTLEVGISLLNRLAESFGATLGDAENTAHAFPESRALAAADPQDLRSLGFSRQKARAISEMAVGVADGTISLAGIEEATAPEAVSRLCRLRGIGRWSAEYVLLRGLGRIDWFPADDVGAQARLQHLFVLESRPGYEEVRRLTAAWEPYAGMVYFHLLLDGLAERGLI